MDKSGDSEPASIIVSESGSGITKNLNIRVTPGWLPRPAAEWLMGRIQEGVQDPRTKALCRARDTLRAHNLPVFEPIVLSDPIRYDKTNVQRCQPLRSVARTDVGQRIIRNYGKDLLSWTLPKESSDVLVSLSDYVTKVRGFVEDSPAGFAARIVCAYLNWYWACEFGDIETVSITAHDLSALICKEQMKREWDVPAVQGKQTLSNLSGGRRNGTK